VITAAIGLQVADLFPDGHLRSRRRPLRPLRRSEFEGNALRVVNVLAALERLGEPWKLMLTCTCAYCGSRDGVWLVASPDHVTLDCSTGCTDEQLVQALLGRLEERRPA
jgi:hypothetical protein